VAEENEQAPRRRIITKGRLESLSDLIFGLALSIGALTLIGTAPKNFSSLLLSLVYFAFSFLILISVWRSYTGTMTNLQKVTSQVINLNLVLLFLVSIEPFLFNEFNAANIGTQNISLLYALDLGGLFAIQAFFSNSVLLELSGPCELQADFTHTRNGQAIAAACFFISALPFFWTIAIPLGSSSDLPVRFILWIIPLMLHPIERFF
jgi:uncharacterized membrane protein